MRISGWSSDVCSSDLHRGTRKVLVELQDVADLGAAPAVDRLVVVADAADVLVRLRQQPQPEILRDVGVLVLVDQQVAEPLLIVLQDLRAGLEQRQVVHQQVAEIGGVLGDQDRKSTRTNSSQYCATSM